MQNNNTILASVYLNATNDYQQRMPDPTQASISETMEALFDPMNKQYFNQFMDILINRIGFTYIRAKAFENPLKVFKDGKMPYGSTIQEIAPKWIQAHCYVDNAEDVFKLHRPEAEAWYHSQNRQDLYPISVSYDELRTAFTDEFGLNRLIAGIMQTPINSDEYDEFQIMKQLMAEYEDKWGFFKYHLSGVPTDADKGKEFLTAVRTLVGKLQFPSTLYNASAITDIPIFAKPKELVLFITPEIEGAVSVNVLAELFNVEKADINVRRVMVDEFPIPNAVALLTTEDFFVCKDTVLENTSIWNPKTLATNYFYHHWGVYSVSPFVPSILFTTGAGSNVNVITMNPTALQLTSDSDSIYADGKVQLHTNLAGSVTVNNDGIEVKPDSVRYEIVAEDGVINARTRVDKNNVLHLQKRGIEVGDKLTITAISTYINPSGDTGVFTDSIEINVIAKGITPEDQVELSFGAIKDATLEIIPSDTVLPKTQAVLKNLSGVNLPALPTTEWTTDDGTEEGTPGTWTATGWFNNPDGTGTAYNKIDIQESDVKMYVKWTFVAS